MSFPRPRAAIALAVEQGGNPLGIPGLDSPYHSLNHDTTSESRGKKVFCGNTRICYYINHMEHMPEQMSEQKKTLEVAKEFLGKHVEVVFDRPLGSAHPKHGFIYEVNYGYIPGVMAADGEELDAYFLGTQESLATAEGAVVAIIHRENDDDDKLVVMPEGQNMSDEEIMQAVAFQEQFFKSTIIRK